MNKIQINKKGNSTFIMAFVPFGSYYEDLKEKGVAHFIEHMCFKGTETRTRKDIDRAIEGRGGDINAFTDYEITAYHCTVANQYKKEAIEIIKDMITNPIFPKKEVNKEREVILQELNTYKDSPNQIIYEISNGLFYPKDNGFNCSIIGTEKTLHNIKREHLVSNFETHYYNPTMIIVGDVEDACTWDINAIHTKKTHTKSCFKKREEHIIKREKLEQSRVIISSKVNLDKYTQLEKFYLENLLNSIYNDMSGRLFETIREKNNLVYGVSFSTEQRSSGMIEWQVGMGLSANKIKKARKLVEQELTRPVTKKELQYAVEKTIGALALYLDTNRHLAELIAYQLRKGGDWQDIYNNYEIKIKQTSKLVNNFIKDLNFNNNILVGLVPKYDH